MLLPSIPLLLILTIPQVSAPGDVDAGLSAELRQALGEVEAGPDGWTSERLSGETSRLLKAVAESLGEAESKLRLDPGFQTKGLVPGPRDWEEIGGFGGEGLRVRRAAAVVGVREGKDFGEWGVGEAALGLARNRFQERWGIPDRVELHEFSIEEIGDGRVRTATTFEAVRDGKDGSVHQLNAIWRANWSVGGEGLALQGLEATELVRADAERALYRTVTPPGLVPSGNAALGIGELRARFDHRLGLPLLASPAGVAVTDVNGDGFEDVYLCAPGGVPNRLLLGTYGGFVDVSDASGVDLLDLSRGALFADFDRDGDADLVVGIGGRLLFFVGDGNGHFVPGLGVNVEEATSLAAADVDLDGDLDLYVCSYVSPYDEEGFPVPYHDANNGAPNLLLENATEVGGALRFEDATARCGLDANNHRFSFAATFEDFDLDGDADLYVANDFGRNNLYRNDDGHFTDVAAEAGVEDVSAGMGVSFGDVDGDGWPDLLVANMQSNAGSRVTYQRRFRPGADEETLGFYRRHARGNSLFRNLGDGTFADVSVESDITRARWAWGARLLDMDGDGRLDAITPNGFLTAGEKPDL